MSDRVSFWVRIGLRRWTIVGLSTLLCACTNLPDSFFAATFAGRPQPVSFPWPTPRQTRRDWLPTEDEEEPGYGLYSYVLFGSELTDDTRKRYAAAVEAWLEFRRVDPIQDATTPKEELHVMYMPVRATPTDEESISAEWVLQNYDFRRAEKILKKIAAAYGESFDTTGLYLFAWHKRLGGADSDGPLDEFRLLFDLSRVSPSVVNTGVKEFRRQAQRPRYWDWNRGRQLAFRFLSMLEVMGEVAVDVRDTAKGWLMLVSF